MLPAPQAPRVSCLRAPGLPERPEGRGLWGRVGAGGVSNGRLLLPRCRGSRAGKWSARKGTPAACPCWRPWTPSCPLHAPRTSPCACRCRTCTRLAVSEGAGPICSAAGARPTSARSPLQTPLLSPGAPQGARGQVIAASPSTLPAFGGTILLPVHSFTLHPSAHLLSISPSIIYLFIHLSSVPLVYPSICSSVHPPPTIHRSSIIHPSTSSIHHPSTHPPHYPSIRLSNVCQAFLPPGQWSAPCQELVPPTPESQSCGRHDPLQE